MKKTLTCAGCFLLFKKTNNGFPYVYCYLKNEVKKSKKTHIDKKLDFEVNIMPVNNCKVRTGKEYIKKININN